MLSIDRMTGPPHIPPEPVAQDSVLSASFDAAQDDDSSPSGSSNSATEGKAFEKWFRANDAETDSWPINDLEVGSDVMRDLFRLWV